MSDFSALIELLARPGVHSGTDLGEQLDISRVAIKKRIDRLEAEGFPVESLPGQGYRIKEGIELLSADRIQGFIREKGPGIEPLIEVFQSLGSTSAYLSQIDTLPGEFRVAIAESQPLGQGRRGRSWIASPYQNLMLSLAYSYQSWPQNPAGLSLAFSVAVHRALLSLGVAEVQLKWPNDLVAGNAKLGGILVNASGEAGGDFSLILGVGVNVSLEQEHLEQIDQSATDLRRLSGQTPSRNALAAEIISNTAEMLELYPESGFEPFAEYWNQYAVYRGKHVRLFDGETEFTGELQGVDTEGQLCLVAEDGKRYLFNTAELSLRPV